jgi:hypothetical protein
MRYPYQIVAFIDTEPSVGTPIYKGSEGWTPNVALKRRFGLKTISEEELEDLLESFCEKHASIGITFTKSLKPEHMPVEVIEVQKTLGLLKFHNDFISDFGDRIESKFPEREGENYYPHMTITWEGKQVVEPGDYLPSNGHINTRHIERVCLVKDNADGDTEVLRYFDLPNTVSA